MFGGLRAFGANPPYAAMKPRAALHGPVTVAAERGGLLIRWLCPPQVQILPGPLCACTPTGRGNALRARSVLVRVEPGTPVFADRDDRSRSSRSPAIALRCYASGEAARLSIERDGFESRTAHHFRSVAQPGSALRSERRGRWFKSSHSDQNGVSTGVRLGLINRGRGLL